MGFCTRGVLIFVFGVLGFCYGLVPLVLSSSRWFSWVVLVGVFGMANELGTAEMNVDCYVFRSIGVYNSVWVSATPSSCGVLLNFILKAGRWLNLS